MSASRRGDRHRIGRDMGCAYESVNLRESVKKFTDGVVRFLTIPGQDRSSPPLSAGTAYPGASARRCTSRYNAGIRSRLKSAALSIPPTIARRIRRIAQAGPVPEQQRDESGNDGRDRHHLGTKTQPARPHDGVPQAARPTTDRDRHARASAVQVPAASPPPVSTRAASAMNPHAVATLIAIPFPKNPHPSRAVQPEAARARATHRFRCDLLARSSRTITPSVIG